MVGAQQAGQLLGQLGEGEPRQLQPHHPPVADQLSQPDSPLSVTRRLIAEFAASGPQSLPPS
jgi:hypothetical protein